jgi:hypothetical protein
MTYPVWLAATLCQAWQFTMCLVLATLLSMWPSVIRELFANFCHTLWRPISQPHSPNLGLVKCGREPNRPLHAAHKTVCPEQPIGSDSQN